MGLRCSHDQIRAGFTFRFSDRGADDHLYVVISDSSHPEVVIVNMTTRRRLSDTSCIIQAGEHPFVVVETCIAYGYAEVVPTEELANKLMTGDIEPRELVSNDLMLRIWDGASRTRMLPIRCTALLRSQGVI